MKINSVNFNTVQLNKNCNKKQAKVSFASNNIILNKKPEKKLTLVQKINIFGAVFCHGVMGALLGIAYKSLDNQAKKIPDIVDKRMLLPALIGIFISVFPDKYLFDAARGKDL